VPVTPVSAISFAKGAVSDSGRLPSLLNTSLPSSIRQTFQHSLRGLAQWPGQGSFVLVSGRWQ
jgi:hypothetical protein